MRYTFEEKTKAKVKMMIIKIEDTKGKPIYIPRFFNGKYDKDSFIVHEGPRESKLLEPNEARDIGRACLNNNKPTSARVHLLLH